MRAPEVPGPFTDTIHRYCPQLRYCTYCTVLKLHIIHSPSSSSRLFSLSLFPHHLFLPLLVSVAVRPIFTPFGHENSTLGSTTRIPTHARTQFGRCFTFDSLPLNVVARCLLPSKERSLLSAAAQSVSISQFLSSLFNGWRFNSKRSITSADDGCTTGKSSLAVRFVDGHFVDSYYPTIENTFSKMIKYKGQDYSTEIVDTAGQDEYSILNSKHFIGIHGYMLVYSVSSLPSFEMVQVIREKILNHLVSAPRTRNKQPVS